MSELDYAEIKNHIEKGAKAFKDGFTTVFFVNVFGYSYAQTHTALELLVKEGKMVYNPETKLWRYNHQ